jgi:hypothetical protein
LLRNARELEPALSGETFRDGLMTRAIASRHIIVARARAMSLALAVDDPRRRLPGTALEEDPEKNRSEYLAEWRSDLSDFVPSDVAWVVRGKTFDGWRVSCKSVDHKNRAALSGPDRWRRRHGLSPGRAQLCSW